MIYTVTFNPAIDYVIGLNQLNIGEVNRASKEQIFFGGKGINVSWILNTLNVDSIALGFVAGFTGEAIEKGISTQGIKTDFVFLDNGFSRINVKMKSSKETEINGQGPQISEDNIQKLFNKLDNLKSGDTLVLAGSIPNTLPSDMYEKILKYLSNRGIHFVVDATKELLVNVLKYKPFLIKPNNHELAEIFNVELKSNSDIVTYAKKLQDMGARNVLISMAGDGCILVDEFGKVYTMGVPYGKVINSVGAGDSMVAGFIAGYSQTHDYEYALKLGTASGSATAFSEGLAEKSEIDRLLQQL